MYFKRLFDMSDYRILVSTDELAKKVYASRKLCLELISQMDRMKRIVDKTSAYWDSKSAEVFRNIYAESTGEIEEMRRRMILQLEKMDLIISRYNLTEKTVVEQASALPDSVIS